MHASGAKLQPEHVPSSFSAILHFVQVSICRLLIILGRRKGLPWSRCAELNRGPTPSFTPQLHGGLRHQFARQLSPSIYMRIRLYLELAFRFSSPCQSFGRLAPRSEPLQAFNRYSGCIASFLKRRAGPYGLPWSCSTS